MPTEDSDLGPDDGEEAESGGSQAGRTPRKPQMLRWLRILLELSGVAAFALYFVSWSAVDAFYVYFDTQPEEVGISQAVLVARAAIEVATFAILLAVPILILLLALTPALKNRSNVTGRVLPPNSPRRQAVFVSAALIIAIVGATLYIELSDFGGYCADKVAKHGAADAKGDRGPCGKLYTLGAHTYDTEATWLSKPPLGLHSGDKLVLIGENDGVAILYDITSVAVYRVPVGEVELTFRQI